jgi:hypothetical protein
MVEVKVNFALECAVKALIRGKRYGSLSLTSVLDRGGC